MASSQIRQHIYNAYTMWNLNLVLVQIRLYDTKTQFYFLTNTSKSVGIGFNQR